MNECDMYCPLVSSEPASEFDLLVHAWRSEGAAQLVKLYGCRSTTVSGNPMLVHLDAESRTLLVKMFNASKSLGDSGVDAWLAVERGPRAVELHSLFLEAGQGPEAPRVLVKELAGRPDRNLRIEVVVQGSVASEMELESIDSDGAPSPPGASSGCLVS